MKIGLVFPQTEFGHDPGAVRAYAQTAESLGFSHVLAYDHVLGANPDRPGGWRGPYTHENPFLSPFILFSFMAGMTEKLEFASGIIILPQRETALVAKQAATLDVLSGGRFRLGVGVGWNKVEYTALRQDFHTRGRRMDEQLVLLKKLWREPLVTFEGEWHHIPDAGLNPLPGGGTVPLWFGGHADVVLRRVARYGDGWMPGYRQAEQAQPLLEKLWRYVEEEGRSREEIGLEPRIHYGDGNMDEWREIAAGWKAIGASHISFNTMDVGFRTPDEHLAAVRQFAEILE